MEVSKLKTSNKRNVARIYLAKVILNIEKHRGNERKIHLLEAIEGFSAESRDKANALTGGSWLG